MNKKILVFGFPRSGTGSMAKKFNIGHEKWTDKGMSSWHLVTEDRFKENGEKWVHVIRNPIESIKSNFYTASLYSINRIREALDLDEKMSMIEILIKGWIEWNKIISKLDIDETIKIEDEDIIENIRIHPKELSFDNMRISEKLWDELKIEAKKYGYQI